MRGAIVGTLMDKLGLGGAVGIQGRTPPRDATPTDGERTPRARERAGRDAPLGREMSRMAVGWEASVGHEHEAAGHGRVG